MMKTVRMMMGLIGLAVCVFSAPLLGADDSGKVKVFILAGQSNMEGKAKNELLDHQAEAPETKDLFKHLRKDGKWIVRDDVFIKFLKRTGPLTIGYGSPGRTGVELEFGHAMGNHFDEPVVLIKAASIASGMLSAVSLRQATAPKPSAWTNRATQWAWMAIRM